MDLFVDVLLLSSVALFIVGIGALFIKPIRINQKVRHYFVTSLLLFCLSFAFGWESAVKAFNEGYEAGRNECCNENVTVVDSVETEEQKFDNE
ncbi:hypothetical protein [Rhodohalobacter sp.]|uniref:hypothetical protein n=1 Tax=Rhodohalobacter sp. TaxID=1974210 RepID=UPI002ACD987B|nr:hypothetical protein [Rhodohalobacter sp.]MDZ7754795.1 hypothetical protein [Rhodohalobacter sp.]